MRSKWLLAGSLASVWTCGPAFAQTAAVTSSQDGRPTGQPGQEATTGGAADIIVTAQRQSQRLQDVPIAVSAFTAQNLERRQIVNPTALQQSLPSITFTKTNFTTSSFTIRGVGDLCAGATCDSATAIHVNDMPVLNTRLFESEFFDLERGRGPARAAGHALRPERDVGRGELHHGQARPVRHPCRGRVRVQQL